MLHNVSQGQLLVHGLGWALMNTAPQYKVFLPQTTAQFFFQTLQALLLISGLSMNILCMCNKSPMQTGFFTNNAVDLLPTLGFLGGLYNFCNFVIIFSLIKSQWYVEVATYFTDLEMIQYYQKTYGWNKSTKTKNYVINYARYTTLKNHFLWFMLGRVTVMRISKWNSDLQLAC